MKSFLLVYSDARYYWSFEKQIERFFNSIKSLTQFVRRNKINDFRIYQVPDLLKANNVPVVVVNYRIYTESDIRILADEFMKRHNTRIFQRL